MLMRNSLVQSKAEQKALEHMHCTMGEEISLTRKQPGTASVCPCAYDRDKRAPRVVVEARQA